jgi:energy-coupling factor transport system ATP-binding protein
VLVTATDLSVVYMAGTPFEVRALAGVSLGIAPGEVLGVVGATGSGKSTLLAALAGLVDVAGGTIEYGEGIDRSRLHASIGMVFQMPEDQLFERTVMEDVSFGPRQLAWPPDRVYDSSRRAMERVGLDPAVFGSRPPAALSGGEKRRAALAGILSMEPAVLLLDEPTAGLDSRGQARLLDVIRGLNREGTTIAIVTHDLELLVGLATRVAVFEGGRLAALGPADEVLSGIPRLEALGLSAPFVAQVLSELARRGKTVDPRRLTVDAALEEIRRAIPKVAGRRRAAARTSPP